MDLFNAATMGVDPQTGTYLSKEQRVAMFRASRGQGGGNGGGTARGGNSYVKPQSAIVVAEKMTGIVQTLSQNFQNTTQGVAEQVAQNRKDIDNLYNMYEAEKAQEAKLEQKETRQKKLEIGASLRSAREKMIEGMASAAAGLATAGGKIATTILRPVMGFWDKLKQAFLALAGLWVIKNLPELLGYLDTFLGEINSFKDTFTDSLGSIRGVWSVLDNILKGALLTVGRIGKAALDVSIKIGRKATQIAVKVLGAIGNFALNIAKKIVDGIGALWDKVTGLIKPPTPDAPTTPKAPTGQKPPLTPKAPTTPETPKAPKGSGRNPFAGATDWLKNLFGGKQATTTGAAAGDAPALPPGAKETKRLKWLDGVVQPIVKAFPSLKDGMKGFMGIARRLLRVVPPLGFAIDLALNKGVAGQDWSQAIIRSLGSSIAGGLSAAAGAKLGGAAGAGLGALAGGVGAIPGGIIGAALGAIIAGMAGGAAGDMAGAGIYEVVTGNTRTENRPMGTAAVESMVGQLKTDESLTPSDASEKVEVNVSALKGGASTPAGLSSPTQQAFGGKDLTEIIDLPPVINDMRTPQMQEAEDGEVVGPPVIPSFDPDMDIYRAFSAKEYQMAL